MVLVEEQGSGSADPLVGKVIHDRFRVIAPIARGGMGAVYKCEQAPLGRLVALKILSPKHDEEKDPEFRKRFFLEAATVAKLSHPNTVTVFDYGQSEGLYFIVMELLEGVTLKSALKKDGPFTPARALHIIKQMCRSLREAHRLHIIHRDVKPGNVMLLQQGDELDYVKVLDFGLVKDNDAAEEEDLTQAGVFMGSPKYMSPEQIQGDRVDQRSDLYSVGVILYELLSGAPPFVREKQVQILMDHINSPVPTLRAPEGRLPIPDDLAAVVYQCLAKKREDRFEDMDALLNALKTAGGEDLTLTGDYHTAGTPISGVHTLSSDALRSSWSGSGSAPTITGSVSGPTPTPSTLVGGPPASEHVRAGGGRALTAVLGALALVLVVGVGLVMLDPFGGRAEGTTSIDALPEVPEPELVAADPVLPPEVPVADQAQPPVPQPDPAPIRSVLVELDSMPPGAMVRVGDAEYGPTPTQVELTGVNAAAGASLTFLFTVDGHREMPVTRVVPAQGTLEVSARLRRIGRVGPRPEGQEAGQQQVTPTGFRESPY